MILMRFVIKIYYRWRNSFILAALFGTPAMIIMMIFMFKWENHQDAPQVMRGLSLENLIMFLLSTPVQVNIHYTFTNRLANFDFL